MATSDEENAKLLWQALRLAITTGEIEQTAIAIQQIPAPTFHEQQRAEEVRRRFAEIGLVDIAEDDVGNVYGRRAGTTGAPGLLIAAHLDTVFPASTDLSLKREGMLLYGPGIGDNSLGVAALLHLAAILERVDAPNVTDIWFVADVGEEGMGDLRGMRAAVDRLEPHVGLAIAVEGFGFGRIYHHAIAVRRLRIAAHASGGHSWADYGAPSAIHVLVRIAARITELAVPEVPRSTLNVGVIQGGTSVNSIAEEASLLLDLRSEDQATVEQLEQSVRAAVDGIEQPEGCMVTIEIVGSREGGTIPITHPLARAAADSLQAVGAEIEWGSGSTDANVPLARGIPAICLGIATGANAHRLDEYVDLATLGRGMQALVRLVWRLACTPGDEATLDHSSVRTHRSAGRPRAGEHQ